MAAPLLTVQNLLSPLPPAPGIQSSGRVDPVDAAAVADSSRLIRGIPDQMQQSYILAFLESRWRRSMDRDGENGEFPTCLIMRSWKYVTVRWSCDQDAPAPVSYHAQNVYLPASD